MLALGCTLPADVSTEGAAAYDPPPVYHEWWAAVEHCADLRGDLGRIDWYVVDSLICDGHVNVNGCWVSPHTIYIVRGRTHGRGLIKHEMLHDLLQDPKHGPLFDKCIN